MHRKNIQITRIVIEMTSTTDTDLSYLAYSWCLLNLSVLVGWGLQAANLPVAWSFPLLHHISCWDILGI